MGRYSSYPLPIMMVEHPKSKPPNPVVDLTPLPHNIDSAVASALDEPRAWDWKLQWAQHWEPNNRWGLVRFTLSLSLRAQ